MRWLYAIAWLLLLAGAAPFLSMLAAVGIASLAGCSVNEGLITPCLIGGVDFGETLAMMSTMAWLIFITWPLGAAGLALLTALLLVNLIRRLRG